MRNMAQLRASVSGAAVFYLALLSSMATAQNSSATEVPTSETTKPFSGVRLSHKESGTSSLAVEWAVADDYKVKVFTIHVQKDGSSDTIRSPELPATQREYSMENLVMSSTYNICLSATNEDSVGLDGADDLWCIKADTIPIIRDDSIIALVVSLGYIVLMILIGYLCWRYAKNRMEREDDTDEMEDTEETKMKPDESFNRPPQYSPARRDPAVRSSIEDQDIPYITPPVGQLSQDEQDRYKNVV